MTPETIAAAVITLVFVLVAVAWAAHHVGAQSDPGFGQDIAAIHARLATFEKAAMHPIATAEAAGRAVEHATAAEAMKVAADAVTFILDDSGDDKAIAEALARKSDRAQMRVTLAMKLTPNIDKTPAA